MSYALEQSGWATFRLVDRRGEVRASASYLHDSLRELIESSSAVLAGAPSADVTFVEEPEHVVLTIGPIAGGELPLLAVRYPHWPERDRDGAHELLRTRVPTRRFMQQVASLAEQLLADLGEDGYRARWLAPFPTTSLARLKETLASG